MKDNGDERKEEVKASKDVYEGRVGRKGESLDSEEDTEKTETPGKKRTAERTPGEDAEVPGEDADVELLDGEGGTGRVRGPPPEAGEDFEVRKHKIGRRPTLPTKAEINEHYPLHLQYRDWCSHCVAGKARSSQHVTKDSEEESLGVTWNADYAFMGGEYNEAEEGMQASLIMFDDDKESFWAVGADEKGATDAMVKYGVGTMEQSGYNGEKVTFKTDQEPSILALKNSISASRIGETVPIESPVRASKSNGKMENAIKIWQGQLRTIKHYVESRMGKRIEAGGTLFSWLIPFCADILNKFRVGSDGRTAYERITSHACKVAQIGFAEVVDFKLETEKNNRHKADSEFNVGIFWATHGDRLSIL